VDAVAAADDPASVAIIVPYFEQPESLARMYAALERARPPTTWELLVVDDGSTRPPPPPPAAFPIPVRHLRQDDRGCRPGAARNLGAASTDAEVLVFFDSDTLPEPATPGRLARWPAVVPDALAVGRRHHADLATWPPSAVRAWLDGRGDGPAWGHDPAWLAEGYARTDGLLHADDRSFQYVISAVMACGHRLYDDVGGFDRDRDEYGGDDWDFAYRAFNNGAVLLHAPDAVAWHDEPDWADRDGRAEVRNAQTAWLAETIPEPSMRNAAVVHHHTDVIAEVAFATTASPSTTIAAITSLLAGAPDIAVHVPTDVDDRVCRHFAADPRVRGGSVSISAARRARRRIVIDEPILWDADGLRSLLDRVGPGGPGRVTVTAGGRSVAQVTSTRAAGRARRAMGHATLEELFGLASADVAEIGAVVVDDVDLAAFYGGWFRPRRTDDA
jgi:GT2 family glycosyltransferase